MSVLDCDVSGLDSGVIGLMAWLWREWAGPDVTGLVYDVRCEWGGLWSERAGLWCDWTDFW
jgi:C-terminal processing protease CtpA/Prc